MNDAAQHYQDQARLALFDELVGALRDNHRENVTTAMEQAGER